MSVTELPIIIKVEFILRPKFSLLQQGLHINNLPRKLSNHRFYSKLFPSEVSYGRKLCQITETKS